MIAEKGSEALQSEMKVKKITCPLGKPLLKLTSPEHGVYGPSNSPFHCRVPKQQGEGKLMIEICYM